MRCTNCAWWLVVTGLRADRAGIPPVDGVDLRMVFETINATRPVDINGAGPSGRSKSPLATENLLESTDGALRPSVGPSVFFSRGGSLLPSTYADARYIDAVVGSQRGRKRLCSRPTTAT